MLLDTHTWLWHAMGDAKRIAPRARREVDRATDRGALVVSVVSVFEVTSLAASGRLHLATSPDAWIRQSIDAGRIRIAEMTMAVAIEAGSIPRLMLPDPMDRLLVATARNLDVPLVTRDARILDYIRTSRVGRALDAGR